MKTLTSRQLGMMLCISIISLKFVYFPAIVSSYARNDAYLSVFIGLVIDFALLAIIICVGKYFPDKTLKDIMSNYYGKIVYYLVAGILFFYCIFKSLLAVKEVHHYFLEFLYEDFTWLWFATPIIMLVAYVCAKGLRSVGRTVEILFVIIALGVVITVLVPIKDVNITYLEPFLSHPKGVIDGIFHTVFAYADFIIVALTLGDVTQNDGYDKKILKYALFTYIFVAIFMVIFVGLFKNIGIYKPYAFSDMPMYTDLPNNSARLDWFSSIIWTFALLLQICIMMALSATILRNMFPKIKPVATGGLCACLLAGGMLGFYMNLSQMIQVTISTPFCVAILVLHVAIPMLLLGAMLIDKIRVKRSVVQNDGNIKKVT